MKKALSQLGQIFKLNKKNTQKVIANFLCYSLGDGNKIVLFDDNDNKEAIVQKISGLNINFGPDAQNNKILIHKDNINSFANCNFNISGSDGEFIFHKTDRIHNLSLASCCGNFQRLVWGKDSNTWGCCIYLNEERAELIIGEDCMFSGEITIWATDGHVILDKTTKEALNPITHPVIIGNHCWIGQGVRILKSAKIPDFSVVGGGAVVTKKYEEPNVILAGNPAKIIKHNIEWKRENTYVYQSNHK